MPEEKVYSTTWSSVDPPYNLFEIQRFSLPTRPDGNPVSGILVGFEGRRTRIVSLSYPVRVYSGSSPEKPDDSIPIIAVVNPNTPYDFYGVRLIVCPGTGTDVLFQTRTP